MMPLKLDPALQKSMDELLSEMQKDKKIIHGVAGEGIGALSDVISDLFDKYGKRIVSQYEIIHIQKLQIQGLQTKLKKYEPEEPKPDSSSN